MMSIAHEQGFFPYCQLVFVFVDPVVHFYFLLPPYPWLWLV